MNPRGVLLIETNFSEPLRSESKENEDFAAPQYADAKKRRGVSGDTQKPTSR